MGDKLNKWKELEMKVKVITSIVVLFSTLGFGGSINFAWGFLEQLQKNDMRHDNNIQVLTEEAVNIKYQFNKNRLETSIKEYKKELFDLRREYGGKERSEALPEGDDRVRMWYHETELDMEVAKKELEDLKKEIKVFENPLNDIDKGGQE